jgi:tetratricopeptide (TPR) repeat protein
MRLTWRISLFVALSVCPGIAQSVSLPFPVNAACVEVNQTVLTNAASGRMAEAERILSMAMDGGANGTAKSCAGLALNNIAALMLATGRLVEGERLAKRSVATLEKLYTPHDLILLRPLQVLIVIRLKQGKTAKAREAVKEIQSIRAEGPQDKALVHGIVASLMYAEHRRPEAETEYLASLRAWEEAGRGNTADAGAVFNALGTLYMDERRFQDARQALDRALAIFTGAKDVVPIDRIKLLNVRGVLHARQNEWAEAREDLQEALSIADHEPSVSPADLRTILINYAKALHKNHRPQEARPIEARIAALQSDRWRNAVVDVTELSPLKK